MLSPDGLPPGWQALYVNSDGDAAMYSRGAHALGNWDVRRKFNGRWQPAPPWTHPAAINIEFDDPLAAMLWVEVEIASGMPG